ncbi:uncharacterized protein MEPE_04426 [Melanopsichium pennsylvanicum]|uniref:Uncharacterized protein n=2 Tax=Melanopsichium pennsylvanicum TaxID=63383 RepID=A0AAJ4XNZ8_9BASI|nr:domain-containing protein [Melanopsichium pennsylvanicum 4]SNX85717.1 uncharacterized protein MEPE_04426 [Melanopsichium pennsylvanicum]
MPGFHMPFRGDHDATPPNTRALHPGPDEVIDPNLCGPFGHRYHDSTVTHSNTEEHEPLNSHAAAAGWHNVETTEQHRQHERAAPHEISIPLQSIATTQSASGVSQAGFVTHAAPMALDYTQDSRYTVQSTTENFPSSSSQQELQSHLHRRSKGSRNIYQHAHTGSLFDIVHGRQNCKPSSKPHVEVHGDDVPITFRHLLKRPVIRQWLHGNKLYREKDERKPSQFELVFDLIFVAVVNGLGHATAESSSAINALKFLLSFWPCFSIWTDVRLFLNTSGTDDMLERLLLLGWMILLGGYCANVSGVEIVKATPELLARLSEDEQAGDAPAQTQSRGLGAELAQIFRRAGGETATSTEETRLAVPAFGDYWFTDGYDRAIHAAIGFFLVSKLWRLGVFIYYGFCLPKFRKALWLNGLANTVIAAIYIPITLTDDPLLIFILMCVGIIVELARAYVVAAAIKLFHGRQKRTGSHMFIPAQSHEHSIERYVLFVILIVGESIISSNFIARPGSFGVNPEFGRAALGITISVLVIWIYYDADGSRVYQHALRRNSFTSITFGNIHFPLTSALILMAASLSSMISNDEIKGGYVWYFGGSASCVMLCLGLIGCMHRNLDVYGSTLIPRWVRISFRFLTSIEFAVLPLKKDWNSLNLMGVVAASLMFLVFFETLGKIGAVGRQYDEQKAREMYASMDARGDKKLRLDKRARWHPFEDLTPGEKGEEDVGIESEIGHLEEKDLTHGQRWAYSA